MPEDPTFDLTKFAALLIQQNIDGLVATAQKVTGAAAKGLESKLRSSYTAYILASAEHYGTARTFFIRDERKPLYNYYVPLEIRTGKSRLPDASIAKVASAGMRAIIAGKAGCGKSTLMRHLFLDSIKDSKRIPVFVELNQLKGSEVDLWSLVFSSFKKHGGALAREQLENAVKVGGFTILFDGLDEVEDRIKDETVRSIADFASEASKSLVIVSSRPDQSYAALKAFNLYEVQPLSLDKAVSLVEKIPFDEEIRAKFVTDLQKTLFKKHNSFLSNPLLLSIMLLTYGQSASIPNKICVFYNQAYEALFQTHDAYKGGYARQRQTVLDIQEFEKAFSAFCLLSYDKSDYSFAKINCMEYIQKAKQISGMEFPPAAFMNDCLQSVNLLMEDGLNITFVHRSFQEYFAAKYVSRMDLENKKKMLARFGRRSRTDNVLDVFWEIDSQALEDLWIVPLLTTLRDKLGVKRRVGLVHYVKYIRLLYTRLVCLNHDSGKSLLYLDHHGTESDSDALRNAVRLSYLRYFRGRSSRRGNVRQDAEVIMKLFPDGKNGILTKNLKARSALVKALTESGGLLSLEFVQVLVDIPSRISAQRAVETESLEGILGL